MATSISAMLSIVLGGLVMAVQTAREHTEGLQEASLQAQVAVDRIKYMVSHAGVYEVGGEPSTLGLAVVKHQWAQFELPEILVVWSGGREGGMANAGVQQRLPRAEELVIYAPDWRSPSRLVEIVVPGDTRDVDFRAAGFASAIQSLIESSGAVAVRICDRIRVSRLSGDNLATPADVGNVRFVLEQTPSDAKLAAAVPATQSWLDLPWTQGIAASDSGLRQVNLRIELQIDRDPNEPVDTAGSAAVPFFSSASYRYVYRP